MNYFLLKLQFDTAVHFGGADSALSLYTSEETCLLYTSDAADD